MSLEAIQTVDIPFETKEETLKRISDYTVGFVKPTGLDGHDATLGGSGTLVKIDECHAILTAAHVVKELRKREEIGLILSGSPRGQIHKFTFHRELMREVQLPRKESLRASDPPDLSLVILPEAILGNITARKSFYNISKHRPHQLSAPPNYHLGYWAIIGFAEELSGERPPSHGFQRVREFNGKIVWGFANPLESDSEFDAWTFTIRRDESYDGPENFEGYSGGGLWQILFEKTKNGKIRLTQTILSGVAFYQSGFQNDSNTIFFNGRECIYKFIVDALKA
ncbi:MAG: hypothetical protein IIA00_04845 [Proteobacteria bacterium]|nr:hypothetical protein [Pseudomonadota bacterium]